MAAVNFPSAGFPNTFAQGTVNNERVSISSWPGKSMFFVGNKAGGIDENGVFQGVGGGPSKTLSASELHGYAKVARGLADGLHQAKGTNLRELAAKLDEIADRRASGKVVAELK